ncbi:hypothetical protein [Blastococcus sp. SYSU D00820]
MTGPLGWQVPDPRAATAVVPAVRTPTAAWSPMPAVASSPPPPSRPRRAWGATVGRWATTVLVAAAVAAGTVWALPSTATSTGLADGAKAASVAPRADTSWQDLEVTGGWVVTGDGARYRVVDGICYLQVHIRDLDGAWGPNAVVAILPESARPAWNHGFIATHDGVPFGELGVFNDGQVLMVRPGTGNAGYVTLSASFPVGV